MSKKPEITLHKGDLPDGLDLGKIVAIDTETMGLNPHRDSLCLAQLSSGDGSAHLVQFDRASYNAPNMKALLVDPTVLKLFHFARFDVAMMEKFLGVSCAPVYCTKIASKLVRTYTDRHGLKDLCRELAGVDLSKQQQSSDWGAAELTKAQMEYAASDVLYLRLPAYAGKAGPGGMAGNRHFLPLIRAQSISGVAVIPNHNILQCTNWRSCAIFR